MPCRIVLGACRGRLDVSFDRDDGRAAAVAATATKAVAAQWNTKISSEGTVHMIRFDAMGWTDTGEVGTNLRRRMRKKFDGVITVLSTLEREGT